MPGEVSVAEAAVLLGTSPQSVRTMLRSGELAGEKRAVGSRFVWVVRQDAIDELLTRPTRLNGLARPGRVIPTPATLPLDGPDAGAAAPARHAPGPAPGLSIDELLDSTALVSGVPLTREDLSRAAPPRAEPADATVGRGERRHRPWFLRPRGRATLVLVVLGIPL